MKKNFSKKIVFLEKKKIGLIKFAYIIIYVYTHIYILVAKGGLPEHFMNLLFKKYKILIFNILQKL